MRADVSLPHSNLSPAFRHMKGPLPAWDKNVHYIMSRDFFATSHEKLVSCGNQFDILNNKVRYVLADQTSRLQSCLVHPYCCCVEAHWQHPL